MLMSTGLVVFLLNRRRAISGELGRRWLAQMGGLQADQRRKHIEIECCLVKFEQV